MSEETYLLVQTRIEMGGVYRCCLATVGVDHEQKKIAMGAKSICTHCKTGFTLVRFSRHKHPTWMPDWQLTTSPDGQIVEKED